MLQTRLESRRILNTVVWTEGEEESIEKCRGERQKTRERHRLLHNRTAREKGQHIILEGWRERIKCATCGREAAWMTVLQWPRTKCKRKPQDEKQEEQG